MTIIKLSKLIILKPLVFPLHQQPSAAAAAAAKSLQSCPTLCNPIEGSPPGSSIHGVFQARVLECCHCLLQTYKCKCIFIVNKGYIFSHFTWFLKFCIIVLGTSPDVRLYNPTDTKTELHIHLNEQMYHVSTWREG